ncbi:MAG: twin-arginine translocation signal domain-containing protein [Pseudomonadota bacterium]
MIKIEDLPTSEHEVEQELTRRSFVGRAAAAAAVGGFAILHPQTANAKRLASVEVVNLQLPHSIDYGQFISVQVDIINHRSRGEHSYLAHSYRARNGRLIGEADIPFRIGPFRRRRYSFRFLVAEKRGQFTYHIRSKMNSVYASFIVD